MITPATATQRPSQGESPRRGGVPGDVFHALPDGLTHKASPAWPSQFTGGHPDSLQITVFPLSLHPPARDATIRSAGKPPGRPSTQICTPQTHWLCGRFACVHAGYLSAAAGMPQARAQAPLLSAAHDVIGHGRLRRAALFLLSREISDTRLRESSASRWVLGHSPGVCLDTAATDR